MNALKRVAVVGGGAAGLCCAVALASGNKKNGCAVTVFEQNDRVGKKLLATGNGRCNLTNQNASPADYSSPTFVAPALTQFPPQQVLSFFASLSLWTQTDAEGRVYPLSNQASSVLDALRLESARLGVRTKTDFLVKEIRKKGGGFSVNGEPFDKVVLACGGKAGVKAQNGYDLLRSLGIPVTKTAPGLVKLTTSSPAAKQLKGVRAGVRLTLLEADRPLASETGELLFGDGVLSGIAAMNLSSRVNRLRMQGICDLAVDVDFVPTMDAPVFSAALRAVVKTAQREKAEDLLSGFLPKSVGLMLLKRAGIAPARETKALTRQEIDDLAKNCKGCRFPITGTRPDAQAQVTLGGAALDAFFRDTLEAKSCRGLYCVGELLDVDAPCGGYNLQWAFASALLCAKSILQEASHDSNQ